MQRRLEDALESTLRSELSPRQRQLLGLDDDLTAAAEWREQPARLLRARTEFPLHVSKALMLALSAERRPWWVFDLDTSKHNVVSVSSIWERPNALVLGWSGGQVSLPWSPAELDEIMERLTYSGARPQPDDFTLWAGQLGGRVGAAPTLVHVARELVQAEQQLHRVPWELASWQGDTRPWVRAVHSHTRPRRRGVEGFALFAWSDGGGSLEPGVHRRALAEGLGFPPLELPHVCLEELATYLRRYPIRVLHLVAHGETRGGVHGLVLSGASKEHEGEHVPVKRLLDALKGVPQLELISIQACRDQRDWEDEGELLLQLCRAGLGPIVGTRLPVSQAGAGRAAEALFRELGASRDVLKAHHAAHSALRAQPVAGYHDWASLALYVPCAR